jgi:hypothetical protein
MIRADLNGYGLIVLSSCLLACPTDPEPVIDRWEVVHSDLSGALLSVWGTSSTDVWAVGSDALDGTGPLVIHFDGERWSKIETGETQGNLWWVFGFEDGPIYMGGEGGVILRHWPESAGGDGSFTEMTTPGTGTVFGIWGATPDDVWAVGGDSSEIGGFAWRLDPAGDSWTAEPSLPAEIPASAAVWKVFGTAADDAWFVGSNGVALHWDGSTFTPGETGVGSSLFTVHAVGDRYVAVGGAATGIIVENTGDAWVNVTPTDSPPPGLSGVTLGEDGFGIAVGTFGSVYSRSDAGWVEEDLGFNLGASLHGSWIDETGGVWVVGGQVFSLPLNDGILLHRGASIPNDGL